MLTVSQDVLIENNTFGDCAYGGGKRPVIYIETDLDKTDYIFEKIIINNNTFNNFNPSIIKANGVKHLEFTNNTINNSKTFEPIAPEAYVIDVKHIETLKVENVKISKDFTNKLKIEEVKNNLSDIK